MCAAQVLTKQGKVVVEGVNVKVRPLILDSARVGPCTDAVTYHVQTKTVQPKMKDEKGTTVQTESPVHHSNVMLYSKEQKVRSRIGHKCGRLLIGCCLVTGEIRKLTFTCTRRVIENGKKVRYLVKTGELLD